MDRTKSRFVVKGSLGAEYAVALKRHTQVENGDILEYLPEEKRALVIRVDLKPVMVIDLRKVVKKEPLEILRRCVELGHAIGNQHWPAIVKEDKVYVPLTVDKKVMSSVMDTHHFRRHALRSSKQVKRLFPSWHPTKFDNFSVAAPKN